MLHGRSFGHSADRRGGVEELQDGAVVFEFSFQFGAATGVEVCKAIELKHLHLLIHINGVAYFEQLQGDHLLDEVVFADIFF